jgi:thioesterase domain-containing protein
MLELNDRPSETWIVPFRRSGTKAPLFCVCAGGGDVFDYRDLADTLPHDQPVYVFGLPTRAQAAQFPTVEQLAAIYLQKIRELQYRGPYHLCGHSFGGIVVYEMARLLAAKGQEVGLIALIDTLHPQFVQNMPPLQKAKFRFTYLTDRIYKYISNIKSLKINDVFSDLRRFVYFRVKQIAWKGAQRLFDRPGRNLPNQIRSDAMILAAAWHRYIPGAYHGPILLLNARDRPVEYRGDQTLGWQRCVIGPITAHIVPGDHYTIMHPPHVETLATWLKFHLDTELPRSARWSSG